MKLIDLVDALSRADDLPVNIYFPDAGFAPAHFHLTEVGLVTKKFVDCGGSMRETTTCALQIWVANDTDHRLKAKKFLDILRHAVKFIDLDTEVTVEYQADGKTLGVYSLFSTHLTENRGLNLITSLKNTACLAPDKCGVKGCC
jgi:hypothetical protein